MLLWICFWYCCILSKFYIKPQRYLVAMPLLLSCILSKFYIKPQQQGFGTGDACSCILSKFYIKPQRLLPPQCALLVVSYRNSTSNHNFFQFQCMGPIVVSYRNSTSNHNGGTRYSDWLEVVSYRNSTSNHNTNAPLYSYWVLYLIEILHQTTTMSGP